ncbi:hypothetical protein N2152v2_003887 [Parachlorella kessleri]
MGDIAGGPTTGWAFIGGSRHRQRGAHLASNGLSGGKERAAAGPDVTGGQGAGDRPVPDREALQQQEEVGASGSTTTAGTLALEADLSSESTTSGTTGGDVDTPGSGDTSDAATGGSSYQGLSSSKDSLTNPSSPSSCPPLSQALLASRARDNTIMLGMLSSSQTEFGLNWLSHLRRIGLDYFFVGAVDSATSALLASMQVPCFDYVKEAADLLGNITISRTTFLWGQEGWRRVVWLKVKVLLPIVDWGFNIVFTDLDTVWMRSPLLLFDKHPHADLMFATDLCSTYNAAGEERLEWGGMKHNFNVGLFLLRNNPRTVAWTHAWYELGKTWLAQRQGFGGAVQAAAYNLTRVGPLKPHPKDSRLFTAWNSTLYLGIIPPYLFANGNTFTVQRLHEKMRFKPYVLHLVWTYNGKEGKRARARDVMLWQDEDAYYSQPSFVTVDLRPPQMPANYNNKSLTKPNDMYDFHLAALQLQLAQAAAGMALAVASGRAFISPKASGFQCFCERSWMGLVNCRMWEAQDLQLPFTCPTDYLFQSQYFDDEPQHYGFPIDFREPSFLDNPSTPEAVKGSVLVIRPTAELQCRDCVEEEKEKLPDGATLLRVPSKLRDKQLLPLLEPYTRYRVWRLQFEGVTEAKQAFGGFQCAKAAWRFDRRIKHLSFSWCCRNDSRIFEGVNFIPWYQKEPGLDTTC